MHRRFLLSGFLWGILQGCQGSVSQRSSAFDPTTFELQNTVLNPFRVSVHSPVHATLSFQLKETLRLKLQLFTQGTTLPIWTHTIMSQPFIEHNLELGELQPSTEYRLHIQAEVYGQKDSQSFETFGDPLVFRTLDQAQSTNTTMHVELKQGIDWNYQFSRLAQQTSITLEDAPDFLSLDTIDLKLKAITDIGTLLLPKYTAKIVRSFSQRPKLITELDISVLSDPLVHQAWHIQNRGQNTFAFFSGTYGWDARVDLVHRKNILGRDVLIKVIDTGLQLDHPDLINQVAESGHVNFEPSASGSTGCKVCDSSDPSPFFEEGEPGDQGTAVAGILASEGWNGEGSRGVAPKAQLVGYNPFSSRMKLDTSMLVESFSAAADVLQIGHSILKPPSELSFNLRPDPLVESLIENAVLTHRDYQGSVLVKAAGDFHHFGLDANMDPYNNLPWLIVVGSMAAQGRKSRNALSGASLWITAPGGEPGYASDFERMDHPKIRTNHLPALVSTDMYQEESMCKAGYAKNSSFFNQAIDPYTAREHSLGYRAGFNLGWNALNPKCSYAAALHGTAAASAVVSGVAALILEANPELSWREIKRILARSARPIDTKIEAEYMSIEGHKYIRTLGWIKNAAGFSFHNSYGFGLVDADKAVQMALSRNNLKLPPMIRLDWRQGGTSETIPAHNASGLIQFIPISEPLIIESVQIKVNLTHEDVSHLSFELISPSGTRSILLPGQNGLTHRDLIDHVLLSNAFYGETAKGNWSFRIVDTKAGRSDGNLSNWSIQFVGYYN